MNRQRHRVLPINLFAVADLHDENDQLLVLDGVDDSIVPFAYAIEIIITGEFFDPLRARISTQGAEPFDNPFLNRLIERFELAFSRRGEENREGHRGSLEAELLQNDIEWLGALLLRFCQGGARIG